MSSIQIVPTHRSLQAWFDLAPWRGWLTGSAPATPMGGRVIAVGAPRTASLATFVGVALVMLPMLVVGVAAATV